MTELTCHCGAVRISVKEPPEEVTGCNCSVCRRYGALWAYYSSRDVTITSEPSKTETYVWGDRTLAFHRCRTCGCVTHWAPLTAEKERMGVNARMMDPGIMAKARRRRFDGAESWSNLDGA